MDYNTLNSQFLSLLRETQQYVDEFYHEYEEICCCFSDEVEIINTDLEPTFSQKLFKYIKAKGISETECYKGANIDRRLFSKIRSNDNYQPSKITVFALIVSLKLSAEEADDLLESAGFTISHSYKLDTVMEFLIEREVYDINLVNEILHAMECPLLGTK